MIDRADSRVSMTFNCAPRSAPHHPSRVAVHPFMVQHSELPQPVKCNLMIGWYGTTVFALEPIFGTTILSLEHGTSDDDDDGKPYYEDIEMEDSNTKMEDAANK